MASTDAPVEQTVEPESPDSSSKSPLHPQRLVELLLHPSRYFSAPLEFDKPVYYLLAAWMLGISSMVDRLDTRIMQAYLRDDSRRWEGVEFLAGAWPRTWLLLLAGGVISGALVFWIGGWFCKMRIKWSGDPAPDARKARLMYAYSCMVFTLPQLVIVLLLTLIYPSYLVAYDEDTWLSLLLVALFFWSMWTTYQGALTMFAVSKRKAQMWFMVIPGILIFMVAGGLAWLLEIARQ